MVVVAQATHNDTADTLNAVKPPEIRYIDTCIAISYLV